MRVEIVETGDGWSGVLSHRDAARAAAAVAAQTGASGEAALALADDAMLHDLNRRFRGKDKATNVLSFPSGEEEFLGDIAISLQTVVREAAEQDKKPGDHALHMLVHGLLHLLGYDHDTDEDAEEMESLERRVLENLGIADPYGDRPRAH